MATVLDSLVIKLGFETKNFKEGVEEAKEAVEELGESQEKLAASSKKSGNSISTLASKIFRFASVIAIGAAIKSFVSGSTQAAASVNKLSKSLGISAKEVDVWTKVAAQFGGGASDVEASFGKLQTVQGDLFIGKVDSNFMRDMSLLGVSFNQNSNKVEIFKNQLIALREYQKKYGVDATATIADNLGISKSFQDLIFSGKDLNKIFSAAERNSLMTGEIAQAADDTQQSFANLKSAVGDLGMAFASNFTPSMKKASQSINEFIDDVKKGDEATTIFGKIVNKTANFFGSIYKKGDKLGDLLHSEFSMKNPIEIKSFDEVVNDSMGVLKKYKDIIAGSPEGKAENKEEKRNKNLPRNIRNFNPGNLEFRGQKGASLEEHNNPRFASFNSKAEGVSALSRQLMLYKKRGIDSIDKIIKIFAPPNENNTNKYIGDVASSLNVDKHDSLNLGDSRIMKHLIEAITQVEGGKKSLDFFQPEIDRLHGAGVMNSSNSINNNNNQNLAQNSAVTNSTNINTLNVVTQSTDAFGMARGAAEAIKRNMMVMNTTGAVR